MFYLALAPFLMLASPVFAESLKVSDSTLIQDLVFEDSALESCIKIYGAEQGYLTLEDYKEIPCFHKGIKSIKGLEVFSETLVIDLSRNPIDDWTPLMGLGKNLGYLDIHDSPISCQQMIKLARSLPQSYLIGFDVRKCLETDQPPVPPVQPSSENPRPETPRPVPPSPFPVPQPTPTTTYQKVASTIAAHCGSCHQNAVAKDGVALDTEVQVTRWSKSMIETIEEGEMPPRSPGWASRPEAQQLLEYLRSLKGAGTQGNDTNDEDEDEDEDD